MRVEVVDLTAEWLADATYGVNALLAAVPRKAGDAAPPNVAQIYAETRQPEVARGVFPQAAALYPLLVVSQPQDAPFAVAIRNAKWESEAYPVAIAYAIRKQASDVAIRDAGYTLRAVMRSLYQLENPFIAQAVAARTRNDITLQGISGFSRAAPQAPVEDVQVLDGILVHWRVVDTTPGG